MSSFQSSLNLTSLILLIFSLCFPMNAYSDEPNNLLVNNAKRSGEPDVASLISLSCSSQSYSVTSYTDNPGARESIYIDAPQLSTIENLNSIPAGTATISATVNNSYQGNAMIKWYIDGSLVQQSGNTYTFSATGRNPNRYKLEARLGNSKKAINVYVAKCTYKLKVQNTSSGNPFSYSFSDIRHFDFVGHVSWHLAVEPSSILDIYQFRGLDGYANVDIGFHANSKTVGFTGITSSPTPSFHIPDSISAGIIKDYPVSTDTMLAMLRATRSRTTSAGDYVLGEYCDVPFYIYNIHWEYPSSINCVTTATEIGKENGLSSVIPSGYDVWTGVILGVRSEYRGEAPCFIYDNL